MKKKLQVFDPAMCCCTGVCGVEVDPVLAQFAADLQWFEERGVVIERHNLSQQPQAFAANQSVLKEMEAGVERLPIILIDGEVASIGSYPSREQLARKLELSTSDAADVAKASGCCTPGKGCC